MNEGEVREEYEIEITSEPDRVDDVGLPLNFGEHYGVGAEEGQQMQQKDRGSERVKEKTGKE